MYKKNNKKCMTCGTVYTYCPDCAEFQDQPLWKNAFCSENCKNIWMICVDFNSGVMDIDTAKTLLEGCDLSDREHFDNTVQTTLNLIYAPTKKVVNKEAKEQPKIYSNANHRYVYKKERH